MKSQEPLCGKFGPKAKKTVSVAAALMTLVLGVGVGTSQAQAADITWGGTYRVEGIKIKNPELNALDSNKAYLLHHLVLMPKIVASDGITIYSRLDLFNNQFVGVSPSGQVYSVAGDVFGNGPREGAVDATTNTTITNNTNSNAWSRTQRAGNLAITSLYGSWVNEFGQLVVGRMPIHFGLGTAFNAGTGLFDHYIDTKDVVGYKVVLGNFWLMPMIGKVNEGVVGEEDDINDYLLHVQYDNPETELSLGLIYQLRVGTHAGNDTPLGGAPGPIGATSRIDGFNNNLFGLFVSQRFGNFRLGVEADMLNGSTGTADAGGAAIDVNAFGVAAELGWARPESKFSGALKAGFASGDDPGTTNSYEGFIFSRNYDVGMLMFNHPLGQTDILRTGLVRNGVAPDVRNQIDTEAISNAIYVAPSVQYRSSDTISYGGSFVYGMLNKEPAAGAGTNLGFEVDLNVTYKPYERLTWITEAGILAPGDAWKAGGNDNQTAYGITTKAAVSF